MQEWTKEKIIELLETNDKAVCRALVAINKRQTLDEQDAHSTKYRNGVGFSGVHATIGTSHAKFYEKNGFLTHKQINWWRQKTGKSQRSRISLYAGQLLEIAKEKTHVNEF